MVWSKPGLSLHRSHNFHAGKDFHLNAHNPTSLKNNWNVCLHRRNPGMRLRVWKGSSVAVWGCINVGGAVGSWLGDIYLLSRRQTASVWTLVEAIEGEHECLSQVESPGPSVLTGCRWWGKGWHPTWLWDSSQGGSMINLLINLGHTTGGVEMEIDNEFNLGHTAFRVSKVSLVFRGEWTFRKMDLEISDLEVKRVKLPKRACS